MAMNHSGKSSGLGLVRVRLNLTREPGSNWPPTNTEVLWAQPTSAETATIDNIPFYACGIAYHDSVRIRRSTEEGIFDLQGIASRSGHSTYRLIWSASGPDEEARCEAFLRELEYIGCGFERGHGMLFAIDIPPGVDVGKIYALLEEREKDGLLSFDEGYYYSGD
jgi:hypothetical protein